MTLTRDPQDPTPMDPTPRKRGGCLTTFLMLVFMANPLLIAYYVHTGLLARSASQGISIGEIWARLVLCVLNLVWGVAIWRGKRWGMVGFAAVPVASALLGVRILEPEWWLERGYPYLSLTPLLNFAATILSATLYGFLVRLILTRSDWRRRETVKAVALAVPALLLSALPGLTVGPFDLLFAQSQPAGVISGTLLALLVRPSWPRMT